jgi:hypothetical protein
VPGLSIFPGLNIKPGTIVLLRQGKTVWSGELGSPIEDAVFDTIVMHPQDLMQLHKLVSDWLVTPRTPPP